MLKTYESHNTVSRLLDLAGIDEIDELDAEWEESFRLLKQFVSGASGDSQIAAALATKISEKGENTTHVAQGLVFAILTGQGRPAAQVQEFSTLSSLLRDSMGLVVSMLQRVVIDKYTKLREGPRKQLVWLVKQLVASRAKDAEDLCQGLLRQVPGGNASAPSTWLAGEVLAILTEHREWLFASAKLIPYVVYGYLRLITDHGKEGLKELREKEVQLCVALLREKFAECRVIGRDLVRLLQDVAKLPAFEQLWKDLMADPKSFSPHFHSVQELLAARTPRKFLLSRVTPDMEAQLLFVLQKVKMGNQKRYQQWFHQNYLSAPEAEALVPDLIRFICGVYHPPNHILSSDVCPRWAIIGWLLNLCTKSVAIQANAKLALFYDWLFFDLKHDNIMNIEPGMLLMMHSLHKYPQFAATLLEFVVLTMEKYDASHPEATRKGVNNSLHIMLTKGVVGSIEPLVNCPAIDPKVRAKIAGYFAHFLPGGQKAGPPSPAKAREGEKEEAERRRKAEEEKKIHAARRASLEAKKEARKEVREEASVLVVEDEDVEMGEGGGEEASNALASLSASVLKLVKQTDDKAAVSSAAVMSFQAYLREVTNAFRGLSPTEEDALVAQVIEFLLVELADKFIVHGACVKVGKLGQRAPLLVDEVFSMYYEAVKKGDSEGSATHRILAEVRKHEPAVGYHFLLYLAGVLHDDLDVQRMLVAKKSAAGGKRKGGGLRKSASSVPTSDYLSAEMLDNTHRLLAAVKHEENLSTEDAEEDYLAYLAFVEHGASQFFEDCRLCAEADSDLFFWMLPYLCGRVRFTAQAPFVRLVTSTADPMQFNNMLGRLMHGGFELLAGNALAVAKDSLGWESYEQQLLWQIIRAEFTNQELASYASEIFKIINPDLHFEALTTLQILLHGVAEKELVETVVTLSPIVFQAFPSDMLCTWYLSEQQATVSEALEAYLQELAGQIDSKAKEIATVLSNLVVWYHRMGNLDSLDLVTDDLSSAVVDLTSEFDDRLLALLPKDLGRRGKGHRKRKE